MSNKRFVKFERHLSTEEAVQLVESGHLFRGTFRVYPNKRKIGFVSCANMSVDLCVDDELLLRNRAVHGDIVALELLHSSEWLPRAGSAAEVAEAGEFESEEILEDGDDGIVQSLWQPKHELLQRFLTKTLPEAHPSEPKTMHEADNYARANNLQPKAKVVCILEHNHKINHIGSLALFNPVSEGQPLPPSEKFVIFKPSDAR